ncbi:hypothetical protein BT96DRAFT_987048 [Gymnopus androsaceus JB14]|uniref:Uncharacterized protein n=1 Tax=Gymnopus androsaceus JB14 TaxID=1447944 RepID=A0A6A4IE66_9AGAR|nr:hypothetical protein BT96DRAFT_987048 [Gymnopus androsaceus JB14]
MVQTRAQFKLAAAAASATRTPNVTPAPPLPISPLAERRPAAARNTRKRTSSTSRAQHSGTIQTPARRASRPGRNSKNIASSSKVKTPTRPATPVFTEGESSLDSIDQPKTPTPVQQPAVGSSASSVASLSARGTDIDDTEPTAWVRFGNDLRHESVLPAELAAQIQTQQQASIIRRAENAYNKHTKEMMRNHNLTYQWYDRMMTEGLQNGEGPGATAAVMGRALKTVAEDDVMTDVDSDEESRDSDMEDGETSTTSTRREETDMEEDTSYEGSRSSVGTLDSALPMWERKQWQPCAPGVRYSLYSTPTMILPSDD